MDLAGAPTAFGCPGRVRAHSSRRRGRRKLKAAGAVIVGKTNSPEIGLWPFTEGPAFGATRNPWSLEHTPGGSSGGAAAAVAAGLLDAAVGSDGAGSIRIPAAWTNLVGIKPQRGRVSTCPTPRPSTASPSSARWPAPSPMPPCSSTCSAATSTATCTRPPRLASASSTRPGEPPDPADRPRPEHPLQRRPRRASTPRSAPRSSASPPASRSSATTSSWPKSPTAYARRQHHPPLDGRRRRVGRAGCRSRSSLDHRVREALAPARPRASARPSPASPRRSPAGGSGGSSASTTSFLPRPPPSRRCRSGRLRGSAAGRPTRRSSPPVPTPGPGTSSAGPALNVPAGFTESGLPIGAQLLGPANSEPLLISLASQLEEVERWQDRRPPFDLEIAEPAAHLAEA